MSDQRSDAGRAHICLLSTADWNAPLWTNKQYMARELGRFHDVLYVESIGLRRPRLTISDARRIAARLQMSTAAGRPPSEGVAIVKPRTVPIHHRTTRSLNERLLAKTVRSWIDDTDRPRVLWTYSPLTYGLERHADAVVYHSVDLLGAYPGISDDLIDHAERRLAAMGAQAIASSDVVDQHLRDQGFGSVKNWPNVADVEPFIERARQGDHRDRRVVFGGNITPYKVDLDLVERLAREVPEIDLVLAGPFDEGGAGRWRDPDALSELGVTLAGTLSLDELAALFGTASVGIIPYVENEYTRGVNPLKLYEYVASGLAVVSTPVPSVVAAATDVDERDLRVAATTDEFVAAVGELATAPSPATIERRTEIASAHSWAGRGEEARDLVAELVGAPS